MNKLYIVLLLLFTAFSFGQYRSKGGDREKIKTLKIAFITEHLNLSSKEAQAFWPVYNTHEEKMQGFRKTERNEIREKLKDLENLSEKEANNLVNKYIVLEKQKHAEEAAFITEMKGILSAKKTILLMKTEEDFKRQLLRQYRHKNGKGFKQ